MHSMINTTYHNVRTIGLLACYNFVLCFAPYEAITTVLHNRYAECCSVALLYILVFIVSAVTFSDKPIYCYSTAATTANATDQH